MNKDVSIRSLLDRLDIEKRGWVIADHWESDLCAVGIGCAEEPGRLVYISTYQRDGQRYSYECELPATTNADYKVLAKAEDVDFDVLVSVMEQHLG